MALRTMPSEAHAESKSLSSKDSENVTSSSTTLEIWLLNMNRSDDKVGDERSLADPHNKGDTNAANEDLAPFPCDLERADRSRPRCRRHGRWLRHDSKTFLRIGEAMTLYRVWVDPPSSNEQSMSESGARSAISVPLLPAGAWRSDSLGFRGAGHPFRRSSARWGRPVF